MQTAENRTPIDFFRQIKDKIFATPKLEHMGFWVFSQGNEGDSDMSLMQNDPECGEFHGSLCTAKLTDNQRTIYFYGPQSVIESLRFRKKEKAGGNDSIYYGFDHRYILDYVTQEGTSRQIIPQLDKLGHVRSVINRNILTKDSYELGVTELTGDFKIPDFSNREVVNQIVLIGCSYNATGCIHQVDKHFAVITGG